MGFLLRSGTLRVRRTCSVTPQVFVSVGFLVFVLRFVLSFFSSYIVVFVMFSFLFFWCDLLVLYFRHHLHVLLLVTLGLVHRISSRLMILFRYCLVFIFFCLIAPRQQQERDGQVQVQGSGGTKEGRGKGERHRFFTCKGIRHASAITIMLIALLSHNRGHSTRAESRVRRGIRVPTLRVPREPQGGEGGEKGEKWHHSRKSSLTVRTYAYSPADCPVALTRLVSFPRAFYEESIRAVQRQKVK